jgi:Saxitoxin biosynthesis operon protein SxtJ
VAAGIPARLSAADGRRFGLAVGGSFLALAGLAAWRGHSTEAWVFAVLGGALVAAALVVPGRLGPVQRFWMALATTISSVTTPVLMGIIYFLIVTPTGWVRRLAGGNRLTRTRDATSFWVDRHGDGRRRVDMERLF